MGVLSEPVFGPFGELLDQWQDRITDDLRALGQAGHIDAIDRGDCGNRVGGVLGDEADLGLSRGKRDFNVEIALQQGAVAEDLAHGIGAVHLAEDVRFHDN